ncbi:hypothetical protein V6N11_082006 [Hibiscus sabdariffa]|uniref:Uncharacterized protein n=2 Tax=Hibiscus sabdariffa TaxID=183260 RepID=A0ABR2FKV5_9ROSI
MAAAAFTSFLLWLVSCLALVSMARAQDPDQFIYTNGFRRANPHLDGSAEIRSNGLLRLTNFSVLQTGHAFYPSPINFNHSSSSSSSSSVPSLSFSTNFVIAIVPGPKEAYGHGVAFVIAESTDFSHAAAIQYLGLVNESTNGNSSNHFFAVEFDTVNSIDMDDIDENHIGIDLNGVKSNKQVTAEYFSNEEKRNISLDLKSGHPIQVWIDYDGQQQLLNVTLATQKSPKPNQPLLSTSIDLSDILMDTMYLGFSAATGSRQGTSSSHYILGWSFNRSGEAQSLDLSQLPKLPKNGGGRNTVRLISIIAAVALLLIIIGTVYVYRRKKYEEVHEDWEKEYGPHRFSYRTLYIATKGFKDKQLLGFGGFGKVYKGFKSSKGVASALLYLHEEGEQVVLHRDIKASNVLLDSELNGRLGDFGLARLYDRNGDPQTTRLVGTLGYIAPELTQIGRATKASDVFSFGAFLLEVACGRKPFDPNKPPEEIFLVDVVNRSFKRDAIIECSDPRLQGNYVVEEMEKVLKLGLLCSNTKSDLRPTIKEVVQYLEGSASLPDIPLDIRPQNMPSSILETLPQSTEINVSTANNLASDSVISFSSSRGKGLSLNSLSSTDSVLHIGR